MFLPHQPFYDTPLRCKIVQTQKQLKVSSLWSPSVKLVHFNYNRFITIDLNTYDRHAQSFVVSTIYCATIPFLDNKSALEKLQWLQKDSDRLQQIYFDRENVECIELDERKAEGVQNINDISTPSEARKTVGIVYRELVSYNRSST